MRKGVPGGLGNIRVPSERDWIRPKRLPPTSVDRQRALWNTLVRQGKLSPDDAERLASEAGQQPFVQVEERHRLAVRESLWPLTMAIFWVAWEDIDHVARAWAEFEIWRGHLWNYPSKEGQKRSLEEAEHIAFEALRSGEWKATALLGAERYMAEPHAWIDVKWEKLVSRDALATHAGTKIESARLDSHLVRSATIKKPDNDLAAVDSGKPSATRNSGGAPPKWDWEEMWIEIVRLVDAEQVKTRIDLTKKIKQWFIDKYDDHPHSSEIRKRMKRLYETMGWDPR